MGWLISKPMPCQHTALPDPIASATADRWIGSQWQCDDCLTVFELTGGGPLSAKDLSWAQVQI